RRIAIVARHEGHGGDGRELPHEAGDGRQLVAPARMHRQDQRVHPLPPGGAQRVAQRCGVERREAPVGGGVDAGSLGEREDGTHGHHAGTTLTWTGQRRLKRGRGGESRAATRGVPGWWWERISTRRRTPQGRTTTPAASPRCSSALVSWPADARAPASNSWASTWRSSRPSPAATASGVMHSPTPGGRGATSSPVP